MFNLLTRRGALPPDGAVSLKVTADIAKAERLLTNAQRRQLPFATALALTNTAKAAQVAEKREIGSVFDRPTRWALNSVKVRPARKADWPMQDAEVFIPGLEGRGIGGGKYLHAQVHGGPRRAKRHEVLLQRAGILRPGEFTVPARGYPLDAHGNLPGALFNKILSQVQARGDASQNETARSRGRRLRRKKNPGGNYFVAQSNSRLPRGIYERWGRDAIRAVLIFVDQPTYNKRFAFYEIAHRVAMQRFPREFDQALQRALATAR